MSAQDTRAKIAAAANAVVGMNVQPFYWQSSRPGDGMVRWDQQVRSDNRFGFMDQWQVLVVLPQDAGQSERYADEHRAALIEAVGQELVVTRSTSTSLVLDNGTPIGVLLIEGSRSAD